MESINQYKKYIKFAHFKFISVDFQQTDLFFSYHGWLTIIFHLFLLFISLPSFKSAAKFQ